MRRDELFLCKKVTSNGNCTLEIVYNQIVIFCINLVRLKIRLQEVHLLSKEGSHKTYVSFNREFAETTYLKLRSDFLKSLFGPVFVFKVIGIVQNSYYRLDMCMKVQTR